MLVSPNKPQNGIFRVESQSKYLRTESARGLENDESASGSQGQICQRRAALQGSSFFIYLERK